MFIARNPKRTAWNSVLLWWNLVVDRGFGNNGYHSAGAIASLGASVRKSDSEIAAAW